MHGQGFIGDIDRYCLSMTEIIRDDVRVAIEAVKTGTFDLVNIAGNRLATDAMILDKREMLFLGFLLKEVSVGLINVKEFNQKKMEQYRSIALNFLKVIESNTDTHFDVGEIWKAYIRCENESRDCIVSDIELAIYKKDAEQTTRTRTMLVNHLSERRHLLITPGNDLLGGILSQISGSINLFGFNPEDLVFYLVMKVFGDYYQYFIRDYAGERDDGVRGEKQKEIDTYVQTILEIFKSDKLDDIIKSSTSLIGEFGIKWRKYFIDFGEIRLPVERKIGLSPETRKKMEEMLADGLKKEIETGSVKRKQ